MTHDYDTIIARRVGGHDFRLLATRGGFTYKYRTFGISREQHDTMSRFTLAQWCEWLSDKTSTYNNF